MGEREFDVVIFGASGFTGGLVVDYLAKKVSSGEKFRWALAGRDVKKLEKVKERITRLSEDLKNLPLIAADSSDAKSLESLVARTRVVLTTVGPYLKYGEALVAACVKAGTHYCDLTGETPFILRMINKYHEEAKSKGCRIVHCCGFDSIPSDLGALFVANDLLTNHKTKTRLVKANFSIKGGGASGGTLASGMEALSLPIEELKKSLHPYSLNTTKSKEKLSGKVRPEEHDLKWLKKDKDFGNVMPFVMAGVNTRVVRRSSSLAEEIYSEKENPYGSNFAYNETMLCQNRLIGAIIVLFLGVFLVLARIPFIRNFIAKHVLTQPGQGPSAERREKASFRTDLVGYGEENDVKVHARISGGDPGYGDTAKMISETALCLAFDSDSSPKISGVVTPATACGLPLIQRLKGCGIKFEIIG